MSEAEAPPADTGGIIHSWKTSFHNWAIGLSSRDKLLMFWVPILGVGFILVFPPTFEAWINRVEPKVVWIPWSIFSTHLLLVFVGVWMFVLQRVDNAQAIDRGEL